MLPSRAVRDHGAGGDLRGPRRAGAGSGAFVCGAGPVRRFFYVVLPLVMPGILASAIFTFTHSYNEFTLTLLTYGPPR